MKQQKIANIITGTALIAFIVVSSVQYCQTRKANKDELRAYISIEHIPVQNGRIEPNKEIHFRICFKNTGQTPANNITYWGKIDTIGITKDEFSSLALIETDSINDIEGAGISGNFDTKRIPLDSSEFEKIRADKKGLYYTAIISYEDIYKESHIVKFCRKYDITTNSLIPYKKYFYSD